MSPGSSHRPRRLVRQGRVWSRASGPLIAGARSVAGGLGASLPTQPPSERHRPPGPPGQHPEAPPRSPRRCRSWRAQFLSAYGVVHFGYIRPFSAIAASCSAVNFKVSAFSRAIISPRILEITAGAPSLSRISSSFCLSAISTSSQYGGSAPRWPQPD